jgi:chemotaxis protein MotB
VDVAEQLFFSSGSATLKKGGQDVLQKVAAAVGQNPDKMIRVMGHTDNVPLAKTAKFASNWDLSVARATNVVRFLQDKCQIDPKRLVASGRGEFSPVASNDTAEGRQQNRRIEIAIVDRSLVEPSAMPAATDKP